MTETILLSLSPDEAEIIIDALEADMEGYLESAKEARGNARRQEAATLSDAAERIAQVLAKVRAAAG